MSATSILLTLLLAIHNVLERRNSSRYPHLRWNERATQWEWSVKRLKSLLFVTITISRAVILYGRHICCEKSNAMGFESCHVNVSLIRSGGSLLALLWITKDTSRNHICTAWKVTYVHVRQLHVCRPRVGVRSCRTICGNGVLAIVAPIKKELALKKLNIRQASSS